MFPAPLEPTETHTYIELTSALELERESEIKIYELGIACRVNNCWECTQRLASCDDVHRRQVVSATGMLV
eukprot:scaffold10372_cov109-Skeletonema_dohrnii-CCMP3373.AAC.2